MKFHPPHKSQHGHLFAIDDHGMHVQLTFPGHEPIVLTGAQAKDLRASIPAESKPDGMLLDLPNVTPRIAIDHAQVDELRNWLAGCELRTPEEHAALPPAPKEINSGFKVEHGDGTHHFVDTIEEAEEHRQADLKRKQQ